VTIHDGAVYQIGHVRQALHPVAGCNRPREPDSQPLSLVELLLTPSVFVRGVGNLVTEDSGLLSIALARRRRTGLRSPQLTSLGPVENPRNSFDWTVGIVIEKGATARKVQMRLETLIAETDSLDAPLFIGSMGILFFRNRLFVAERPPKTTAEKEEAILRVKKAVYEEDAELANVKAAVANLEAAIEFSKSGPKRDLIPDDVKLVVWPRDGGACRQCGAKQDLHFDHIIPVSKGGGNSEANIQILCQTCNLRKTDKISMV
jgi:HNH endonuclease